MRPDSCIPFTVRKDRVEERYGSGEKAEVSLASMLDPPSQFRPAKGLCISAFVIRLGTYDLPSGPPVT